jgi:pyruvate/2-oxoglutarate dehydrogenase complex dihydrolipoamide dehydrogenase (E3) component
LALDSPAPAVARRLVAAGRKVAIIERKLFGGTCVNTGCTPTKTLVASAYVAHVARRATDYGVRIEGTVNVDMKAVKARKDAVVAVFRNGVERSLKILQGCTVYEGHGRFVAEKKVAVNGSELTADQIFINVGARAAIPPIPGLDQVPYLTNGSMMDIDFLPSHLVILGGSYVGLEFAQVYRRFGSKVTVIEFEPRLISREDEDVSQAVAGFFKEEGIDVRVNSKIVGVERQGNSIVAKVESTGRVSQIAGTHLLVATGRRPNTDDLGLDKAGIATNARGYILVDDQLRTNISDIWAMGDCNGRRAFTHTSWNDFEIVAANLLSRAGMTAAEVRKTGKPALISTMAMKDVMRAYERGETEGFMKLLVDRDNKQILGASFLGLEGDEVIHCVLDIMYAKAPYTVIQRAMHIHPTVSEFIPTMMDKLKPLQ